MSTDSADAFLGENRSSRRKTTRAVVEELYYYYVQFGDPCSQGMRQGRGSTSVSRGVVLGAAFGGTVAPSVPARPLSCASLWLSPTAKSFASFPVVLYPLLR
ncbi:hypothetical protein E2C01_045643 [Portunus trituberculatus]|uniref:Uncharacterized protein n=1 Tax=Portunus trituberculatus TaxID=210409 RepID=A0A5B7G2L6_PORTR|nr:hypothetical protein [Portunus trituberculatus]